MKFKLGDMVVLTDKSKIYFMRSDEMSPIFVVSMMHPLHVYGYKLGDKPNSKTLILESRYRLATESEIKTFKLKNLF
jgi:hypothetical protein